MFVRLTFHKKKFYKIYKYRTERIRLKNVVNYAVRYFTDKVIEMSIKNYFYNKRFNKNGVKLISVIQSETLDGSRRFDHFGPSMFVSIKNKIEFSQGRNLFRTRSANVFHLFFSF